MTKKHFIRLANLLKEFLDNQYDVGEGNFNTLVVRIADMCEESNTKFDRDKFYETVYR